MGKTPACTFHPLEKALPFTQESIIESVVSHLAFQSGDDIIVSYSRWSLDNVMSTNRRTMQSGMVGDKH